MKLKLPRYDAEVVEAIEEYLDLEESTSIEATSVNTADGLLYTFAYGRKLKSNPRPMFDVISDGAFSGMHQRVSPCPCYDFHRSWSCPDHHEIPWDAEGRFFRNPAIERRVRLYTEPGFDSYQDILNACPENESVVRYETDQGAFQIVFETDPRA